MKKVIVIALTAALCFSLFACSSAQDTALDAEKTIELVRQANTSENIFSEYAAIVYHEKNDRVDTEAYQTADDLYTEYSNGAAWYVSDDDLYGRDSDTEFYAALPTWDTCFADIRASHEFNITLNEKETAESAEMKDGEIVMVTTLSVDTLFGDQLTEDIQKLLNDFNAYKYVYYINPDSYLINRIVKYTIGKDNKERQYLEGSFEYMKDDSKRPDTSVMYEKTHGDGRTVSVSAVKTGDTRSVTAPSGTGVLVYGPKGFSLYTDSEMTLKYSGKDYKLSLDLFADKSGTPPEWDSVMV